MEDNNSNVSSSSVVDPKMTLQERASYAGYSIPIWSSMPSVDYSFDVVKKGCFIETINITNQPFYLVGRNADVCDIVPEHPSLSRIHAVLQHGKDGRLEVLDFKSTHGTFLNGNQIKAFTYTPIHVGDYLQFGGSMRMYTLTGPAEMMEPEKEIKIERTLPKVEKQKVKVSKLNVVYLGERQSSKTIDSQFLQRSRLDDDEGIENEIDFSVIDNEIKQNDLTDSEKSQYKKITELRNKRDKMAANQKWKNKNENREETLQKLTNEIEELEQTLYDNIERRRYKENHRRELRERRLDEEDSYYDRTNRKKKEVVRPESRDILVEKLAYKKKMLGYYESQLQQTTETQIEENQSEDVLDQFMNENNRKMKEMKEEMIRSKLEETRRDISDITQKISKMPVLHIKEQAKTETETEAKSTKRDTSSYRVIDDKPRTNKNSNNSAFAASFGSVMDQLKAGNNHSFDNVESRKPVSSVPSPMSMNVQKAPRVNEKRSHKQEDANDTTPVVTEEKRRDMSEYYVPEDMGVAVNKEALEDVRKEMGENQPTFIRRMFDELKNK